MKQFRASTEYLRTRHVNNRLIAAVIFGALWSMVADAHHNPASHYLLDQTVTVEGVVTEFRLINPHMRVYFDVTTAEGDVEKWLGEGQAAAIYQRRGWSRDTLKPGDVIKITGNPARDGGNMVDWRSIELSDGTVLGGGINSPVDRESEYEELDRRRRAQ